jgi:cytochrome c553
VYRGTTVTLTLAQVRDSYNIPDWHPDGHPAMPEIVNHGRRPAVISCGYCHLPNGQGRPENSSIAGLPAAYIVQQMADFKNGLRKSSESRLGPQNLMVNIGKAATDAEVQAAAEYFSKLKLKPWIRVVETATVPKTRIAGGMFIAIEDGGTEPIGNRIIEVPENLERTELRDDASGFIAYAPMGSIKRGEALVTSGGGKTTACAICHGADLKGMGPVPSIAGPISQSNGTPDLGHATRRTHWTVVGLDEAGGEEPHGGRPGIDHRVPGFTETMTVNWKLCLGASLVALMGTLSAAKGQQQPSCIDYSKDPAGCQPSTFDTPIGRLPTVRVNRMGDVDPFSSEEGRTGRLQRAGEIASPVSKLRTPSLGRDHSFGQGPGDWKVERWRS